MLTAPPNLPPSSSGSTASAAKSKPPRSQLIEARLESTPKLPSDRLLVIDGDGWHRGVIGILASRVVERTAKPAIVVSVEDGVAHGSGRSVDGFVLLSAIESCADLFTRFGGHAFAVGFAMPAARSARTQAPLASLRRASTSLLASRSACCAFTPSCRSTALRSVLAGWLRKLEPLGHGNPEPVFVARGARLLAPPRIMKARHLALDLVQDSTPSPNGASSQFSATAVPSSSIRAVGWNLAELAMQLRLVQGSRIDLAYRIRENDHPDYGGLEIEIMGMQAAGFSEFPQLLDSPAL